MELFRQSIGDVRPLNFEKRVPGPTPGARKQTRSTDSEKEGSLGVKKCSVSPQKQSFKTLKEATQAARYAMDQWRSKVSPYECDHCGQYHLTSK